MDNREEPAHRQIDVAHGVGGSHCEVARHGMAMRRALGCLTAIALAVAPLGCDSSPPTSPTTIAHVVSISIVPDTSTLRVGEIVQFSMSVVFSPGIQPPCPAPWWSSDTPDVASVDPVGWLTARNPGQVHISASFCGGTAARLLEVVSPN